MKCVKIKYILLFLTLSLFLVNSNIFAKISVPAIFGNHMVLQKEAEVKLWGWGKPLERVVVTTSWSTDTLKTIVDNQANWALVLKTPEAGGPHSIKIQGYNSVDITDVLIGEVWLLSGQSNMEWSARMHIENGEEAINKATQKEIRFFSVTHRTASQPNYDVDGQWVVCSPEPMIDFSAIGYFFGKKLNEVLKVPVGLINASWGGTPIEVWIPEKGITSHPELLDASKLISEMQWGPREPGRTFNAMVAPFMPFTIAGTLWYQGETNTSNPKTYTAMLNELVKDWRAGFESDFPFIYAQIAPFNGYGKDVGVMVREAQRRALSIPKSAMVVVSDIGDTTNIHPKNKRDAGYRFSDVVLNKIYHKREFPVSGPLFKSFAIAGREVNVYFDYAKGLHDAGDALRQFEIMNANGKWFKAKAVIKNDVVVLSSSKVKVPIQVRFAWSNTSTPKLLNNDKLPASCFSTKPEMN